MISKGTIMNPDQHGLSIVIPAYNEQDGILNVLNSLKDIMAESSIAYEVIVIDDGSTDNTPEILKSIIWLKTIQHPQNLGYGAAIKSGIRIASYDWICITDADGTYPNENIPDFFKLTNENDMIVGARLGSKAKIPTIRKPAKWVLNKLANYLVRQEIPDLNSGLRIFNKSIAEKYFNILPDGFSLTTTITLAMLSKNYRVKYVTIPYYVRDGKSKIRPIYDTINFVQLILRTIVFFDPLRIFIPVSMSLFLLASILFAIRLVTGEGFAVYILMIFLTSIQIMAIGIIADLINRKLET